MLFPDSDNKPEDETEIIKLNTDISLHQDQLSTSIQQTADKSLEQVCNSRKIPKEFTGHHASIIALEVIRLYFKKKKNKYT